MQTWKELAGVMLAALALGCSGGEQDKRYRTLDSALTAAGTSAATSTRTATSTRAATHADAGTEAGQGSGAPFTGSTLRRAELIAAVLARNPSLEAARHSARAALARHGAVTAWSDPMVEYEIAPLSIASDDVELGQTLRISQKLPWPGKRAAAGGMALAEAESMQAEREAMRVELAAMASMGFDRLWRVERALAINAEYGALVASTLRSVREAFAVGRAMQADVLMVELEEARIERERLGLGAERASLVAELNALLHRAPDAPLPAPSDDGPVPAPLPSDAQASSVAPEGAGPRDANADRGAARFELAAQRKRIEAAQEAVTMAERERYPDLVLMGTYTTMFMDDAHRLMVGVGIELPLQQGARDASVEAARARRYAAERELEALDDRVRSEVQSALSRANEAERTVELYAQRLLPTGRARLQAELLAYANAAGSIANVLAAERELRALELESAEAISMLGERRAQLAAALGRLPVELESTP